MKIRMLSTQRGADDGVTVRTYEAGHVYELAETERGLDLALVFLREGWAEEAEGRRTLGGEAPPVPPGDAPQGGSPSPGAEAAAPAPSPDLEADEHADGVEAEKRAHRRRR